MREFNQSLLVAVADDRNHQAVRCIDRDADMEILLEHQIVAIERGIEGREFLQGRHRGFDQEHQRSHFHVFMFFAELFTEQLHLGDIGLIELRDMRNHRPVPCQIGAGQFLDA